MVTAISIVLVITALFLIVTVLLQSSDENGIGALSGHSESYFSRTKAKTFEAKLALQKLSPMRRQLFSFLNPVDLETQVLRGNSFFFSQFVHGLHQLGLGNAFRHFR